MDLFPQKIVLRRIVNDEVTGPKEGFAKFHTRCTGIQPVISESLFNVCMPGKNPAVKHRRVMHWIFPPQTRVDPIRVINQLDTVWIKGLHHLQGYRRPCVQTIGILCSHKQFSTAASGI